MGDKKKKTYQPTESQVEFIQGIREAFGIEPEIIPADIRPQFEEKPRKPKRRLKRGKR